MTAPIEDYALIGDTQTAALVSREGSIDWLCAPRFDSGAVFAALLGEPEHGRWIVEPANPVREVTRRYLEGTMILETEFTTEEGVVAVIDFMPLRDREPTVVRIVEGRLGEVAVRTEVMIRFDYGSVVPWVRSVPGGIHAVGGADAVSLHSEIPLHGEDSRSVGEAVVRPGERLALSMSWHASTVGPLSPTDPRVALLETQRWWEAWSQRCTHTGPWEEQVRRSLLTLKALSFAPTGGIVAAPTTSLPEQIGGVRNWDYRYCWLRDASYTLAALLDAGYQEEADSWAHWFRRAIAGSPEDLQIMYGVGGERRLSELELGWLPGYEGSTPVRIGNAASDQLQLDVYGEVLDLVHTLALRRPPVIGDLLELGEVIMEHLADVWREPDDGIWEVRGGRQHFVHSKVMAWVAADRWVRLVVELDPEQSVSRWERLRDEIHDEVMSQGWNDEIGAFTQSYGSDTVDAGALLIPVVGFLPPDDPKVVSTVDVIIERLCDGAFLHRYDADETDDGLAGSEGTFLLTSFWLVQALTLMGRRDEAVERFEALLEITNDVGLLAEEYDVAHGRQLGNYPQAFSHLGLVVSAMLLSDDAGPTPAGCRAKVADHPRQDRAG